MVVGRSEREEKENAVLSRGRMRRQARQSFSVVDRRRMVLESGYAVLKCTVEEGAGAEQFFSNFLFWLTKRDPKINFPKYINALPFFGWLSFRENGLNVP